MASLFNLIIFGLIFYIEIINSQNSYPIVAEHLISLCYIFLTEIILIYSLLKNNEIIFSIILNLFSISNPC